MGMWNFKNLRGDGDDGDESGVSGEQAKQKQQLSANGAAGGLLDDAPPPWLAQQAGAAGVTDVARDDHFDDNNDPDKSKNLLQDLNSSITGWVRQKGKKPDQDLPEILHELYYEEQARGLTMSQDKRRTLKGQSRRVLRGTNKWQEARKDDQGKIG